MNINIRSIILITAALVVAGIAAFLARSLVTTPEIQPTTIVQQAVSDTQILVSNRNINTGSFLKKEDLSWQSWPDDNLNENYIQKGNDAEAKNQIEKIVGSVTKAPIAAGEPIIDGRIVNPGSRGFMAAVLQPGYRAVSININSRTGLSGFIFPGDLVDILLTQSIDEGGNSSQQIQATETVLTNIRVLAIDTQMSNDTNIPAIGKIATFEVSPKQAEKIALMSRLGELSLSLRSLAVETQEENAPVLQTNGKLNNVTYADEVSTVIAAQTGTGLTGAIKKTVNIVRANETESLTFIESKK